MLKLQLRHHDHLCFSIDNYHHTTMAFVLRRPFAIASAVKQLPKASQVTVRSFQTQAQAPIHQAFTHSKPATPLQAFANARQNVFRQTFQQSSRRGYQTAAPQNPLAQGNLTQRLIYGGAM